MKPNVIPTITFATYLTLMRLACIPCIAVSLFVSDWFFSILFFVIASITDVLDGMVARSFNEVSWLGTILDPLVDKIMLLTIYAGLVYTGMLPHWFLLFVLVHECVLILGALYWSLLQQKIPISPSRLAKLVGLGQFLFIVWVLVCGFLKITPSTLFYQVLFLLAIARACVLVQYGIQTYRKLA